MRILRARRDSGRRGARGERVLDGFDVPFLGSVPQPTISPNAA